MTEYLECNFNNTNFLEIPEVGDLFVNSLSVLLDKNELYISFVRRLDNLNPTSIEIKFVEVCAHHFDHVINPSIAFGIEDFSLENMYKDWEHVFKEGKNNRWPIDYSREDNLIRTLNEEDLRCYRVYGTCGLDGFVLAKGLVHRILSCPNE